MSKPAFVLDDSPLSFEIDAPSSAHSHGLDALNENEIKSVEALIAYVAHNQQLDPRTIRTIVEARFGVHDVMLLRQKDYEEVIRFLVDVCERDDADTSVTIQ
jgi:hypothetical protein